MFLRSMNDRLWAQGRRISLLFTGVWCVGLGIGLIGTLIGADLLAATNTSALLMIVGVITLPALTLAAICQDQRTTKRSNLAQDVNNNVFIDRDVVVHNRHDRANRSMTHAVRSAQSESEIHSKVA
jgi:hypothetical protein